MTVRTEISGARVIVCTRQFDVDTVAALSTACERAAASGQRLVLDVADVTFGDYAFLDHLTVSPWQW
ncbi:hypothetical protein ACFYZT_32165 [Streptomyces sp. NPDC001591]|uniref:hypothetical protein n=1 Tax=Streptomyces sp. NPDC001591 TaxID=3364589 RepID=UPI0036A60A97